MGSCGDEYLTVRGHKGAYCFVANSFEEFYQNWLDGISDTEKLRRKLEEQREVFRNRKGLEIKG